MENRQRQFVALGGPCQIKLSGPDADHLEQVLAKAVARLADFEQKYSRYRADSVVSRINCSAGSGQAVTVDAETAMLLDFAFACYEQSDGLFDITSGALRGAWDFRSVKLPTEQALAAVLPLIGLDKVIWSAPTIELPVKGMELDFGGFGKEYAADLVAAVCREDGIAHGLVDLAGDIAVIGSPFGEAYWPIGICDPRATETAIAKVDLYAGGLASSGDYERFMEVGGKRYSHILNPRTGWPVTTVAGITVIADSCLLAGSLATIAMLQGRDASAQWLAELGASHLVIDQHGQLSGSIQSGK